MGGGYARSVSLVFLLLLAPVMVTSAVEEDGSCCEQDGFRMFLIGEAQSGGLTAFSSDLEDRHSAVVTPSVLGAIEIGKWSTTWSVEGNYPSSEWTFDIPYEIQGATGLQFNATVGVNIGGTYYSGSSGPGLLVTNGILSVPVQVSSGTISEGDQIRFTLEVQSLSFSAPGDDAGIRFFWGDTTDAGMLAKFPLGTAEMEESSSNDGIAYFPVEIDTHYGIDIWNKRSSGSTTVGSQQLTTSPVVTETENGVRLVFVWQWPESYDGGGIQVTFRVSPHPGATLESVRTYEVDIDSDGGTGDWYPEKEPKRDSGTKLDVKISGRATASIVDRDVEITVDGAMSQWIRWGLDNIGNNTLEGSSWWKNLDSYEDSLSKGEEHNGRVDDAEVAALTGHLQTSSSNIRSFMSTGLGIDIESMVGSDLVDLSQRDIMIDFGATRAFSSEPVTIVLEARYTPGIQGQSEYLVRTFIQPGKSDWFTKIDLDAGLRTSALAGFGAVSGGDLDVEHRRWVFLETISFEDSDLDPDLIFSVSYTPPSSPAGSPLVSALILVLVMSITAGLSLYLTRSRIRAPAVATAALFGILSFIVYVGGFDLPLVLGVGAAGLIGVFPVALVSPKSKNRGVDGRSLPTITCPSCMTPNVVHSELRPFRTSCSGCFATLRLD
ncbi:MAG TPA: hypothetical protein D7H73_02795 [Candidatus Poseidoniales archaeon]|nr:MAG TPA: hypothetical protein D7H73_02795 [Candidatus Poseidoniales archaeon]|tara:strand:+ start:12088 stop:14073 length:1986 start_codon:yes stop_codon:yes gene_type:complete